MPFGGKCEYANHKACVAANSDKDDPDAYCAELRRRTEEHCKEAEEKHMTLPTISKTVVPYSGTPTAPRERAWSASAATKRARTWAGGPDKESVSWPKYRRLFVRFDADNTEDFGSYGGPHHDVIDGDLQTVFRGVAALAVVVSGGRGGTSWPDEEMVGIKAHVSKHYGQFDEKAPWERDEKDFAWLPEEKRAAKALGIDLVEAQTALFAADGAGVAKDGCPCDDGSKAMPEKVLIIRNDADVSEEIETPADGIFEEDVAAVSLDNGETWLELEDGRVKEEVDPDPAEAEAAAAAEAEAERVRLAEEEAAAAAQAEADEAAAAEAEAAADGEDKDATPTHTLDHSLLGELAETGYMRYLWNLTYALCDVLCGLIDADDLSADEKTSKGDKALTDFVGLAKSSFAEAVTLATDAEEPNPFADMSFADVVRTALAEAAGLDADTVSSEDVDAIAAQVIELQTKLTEVTTHGQDEIEEAKKLIDELLDMPLERKIEGDTDEDAIEDINEKYPWLDPSVRRRLAAARVK